jgi:hypothetical protein
MQVPLPLSDQLLWLCTQMLFSLTGCTQNTEMCVCVCACMRAWARAMITQPLHCNHQWSVVLPLLINPLLTLHFEWNVELCLWGHHNSHLVP